MFHHPILNSERGIKDTADYSIHFWILAANIGWNDTTLRGVYIQRWAEELKDELAAQEETPDFETVIDLTIHLDNLLRDSERGPGYIMRFLQWPLPG